MSLIITSGYGSGGHLIPTSGYGTSVIGVTSTEFRVDSVELPADNIVRVRYTRAPLVGSGSSDTRADVAANYSIVDSNGNTASIVQASAVFSDNEVIDLHISADLSPGVWTLTVVDTIVSADVSPLALQSPYKFTFELSRVQQDSISLGATNNDCIDHLRRHLNPAFRRKNNWEAVIAGASVGNCIVKDIAQKAFDQLYLSTASGKYLTRRASERGVRRAGNAGIKDDLFRQLAIAVINAKLTQSAMLDVLEVLYGVDAVRAFAETETEAPFVLFDGAYIDILLDERKEVRVNLLRQDFSIFRRATADELAAAITRALENAGTSAYALAVTDPETNGRRVRVYSGARGLTSSVRIVGGNVQSYLNFPAPRFTTNNGLPIWTTSIQPDGVLRLSPSNDLTYNLSQSQVGDYVVIVGSEFDAANRGSFRVVDVHYSYDLNTNAVVQHLDVYNPNGVVEVVQQAELISVQVFDAVRKTQYDALSYAIVAQANGEGIVSIAATTQAVNRAPYTAAYAQSNDSLAVDSIERTSAGEVTVTIGAGHSLQAGNQFLLDNVLATAAPPVAASGTPSTAFPSGNLDQQERSGTSDSSPVSHLATDTTVEKAYADSITDNDGNLWVIGGQSQNAGVIAPNPDVIVHFVESRATSGNGAVQYDYRWFAETFGNSFPELGAALDIIPSGQNVGGVLVAGGWLKGPWFDNNSNVVFADDSFILRKREFGATVLVQDQLIDIEGLVAAMAYFQTNVPASGDSLVITDGSTTRTYGFGVGGDITVAIGATASITMDNLAAAINGDGSAAWGAVATTGLPSLNSKVVVVYEDSVIAVKSGLRMYGTFATQAEHQAVIYADDLTTESDYTGGTTEEIPMADPGAGRAGFHRAGIELTPASTHRYIDGNGILEWDELFEVWTALYSLVDIKESVVTPFEVANAAMSNTILTGGFVRMNEPSDEIYYYNPATSTWSNPGQLKFARAMHQSVPLDADKALVIGGRQPVTDLRPGLGLTEGVGQDTWNFDVDASPQAGPVSVQNLFNSYIPGKVGYGWAFDNSPAVSTGGANQTTLNANLLGDYWVIGWMTADQGVIFKNRGIVGVAEAENMLVLFGVDSSDRFYVQWQHGDGGGNVLETRTFTATTMAAEMSIAHDAEAPRYYMFGLQKLSSGGTTTWSLYINGVFIESVTGPDPTGGGNGLWTFAPNDESEPAYAGALDQVTIDSTPVLTADLVQDIYNAEVGVAYDHAKDPYRFVVGKITNTCEIVDNATGHVRQVGSMSDSRANFGVTKLPDGRVIVAGGIGYNPSHESFPVLKSERELELRSVEIWDPDLENWTPLAPMNEAHSYPAMAYIQSLNRVYIAGGFASSKVEYLDLATMRWHVSATSLTEVRARIAGGLSGDDVFVVVGGADIVDGVEETTSLDHQGVVGAETVYAGGLNAQHRVKSVTGTTVTFDTPNYQHWTAAVTGDLTPIGAEPSTIPGPFIFNTADGIGITATEATLDQKLDAGKNYSTLLLQAGQAANFPSTGGWLAVAYGRSYEVAVVRFLGRISDDELILDASFKFPENIAAGATVTLLKTPSPYVLTNAKDVGAFYITASPAGRVAAQRIIEEISASGIDLDIEVRYPGDRGLGGEGFPARDNYKLSDKVLVWGSDEPDAELEELRGT